ncbi:TraR/DksA C4-type zinc finger protein [Bacillus massilinigeriensis]|uniref:TraR/DksA C4-type zinc finger protein n=1 Tax=Bacillus mediterraneensis TaxID=1805474 RepID=UPI0008F86328|nr:TraR/DksA C4-type zinc finger protein [Bacillus mediterraneensis]
MLQPQQISKLKNMLLDEKETLQNQIKGNNEEGYLNGGESEATGELSSIDNHPADSGTELFERSKNIAMDEHHERDLEKIDAALGAIKDGSYGKCQECDTDIPFERLEIVPYTLYCVDHTPEVSISDDRPAEEDILEKTHNIEFQRRERVKTTDNQDSFQEVAAYGTSETPADVLGDHEDYNNLYDGSKNNEGFSEDYESFTGTDMFGKNQKIYPNRQEERYEEMLDDKGTESQLGNIPYRKEDSYVKENKAKNQ